MLKRRMGELVERQDRRQIGVIAMGAGIVLLTGALVLQLAVPIRLDQPADAGLAGEEREASPLVSEDEPADPPDARATANFMRRGLFKSATSVGDKPMADKTIQRIRSQLKLQCIMRINNEPVAYVNVKNAGLKRCRVGESVDDLFTVLNIHAESIEISIVGHRVTLSL